MKDFAVILTVLVIAFPLISRGEPGKAYPTNVELAQQAAKAAAENVTGQLPSGPRTVVLRVESPRPLDWAVEKALATALSRAGFQIYKATSGDSIASLSCRTVDLGVTYQDRSGDVERVARVRIAFSFAESSGRVLASGDGQGMAQNLVPQSLLAGLESQEIVPLRLPDKESLGSRLAEPALLSAVMAGFIYLFYASKAAK